MPKISEKVREILKNWQAMGVKFKPVAMLLDFKRDAENYSIPAQPVPELVTLATFVGATIIGNIEECDVEV